SPGVTPSLISAPPETRCARPYDEAPTVDTFFVTTYGTTSSGCVEPTSPIPVTVPSCETVAFLLGRNAGQLTRSLKRSMSRHIPNPIVCTVVLVKPSCDIGIANSAVHPSESIDVATSQTPSHVWSSFVSSYIA